MYLSLLDKGQCIIRTPSIKIPFLLQVPWIKETKKSIKKSPPPQKLRKKSIYSKDKTQKKISNKRINKPIKLNSLNFRVKFIQNCFSSGDYSSCYFICLEIIDYIVDRLVDRLNYEFGGVEKLINDIEQNNLSNGIKIYPELKKISNNIKNIKQKNIATRSDILELFEQIHNIFSIHNHVKIDAL